MIKFVLLVNKQGQTRLAKYTDSSLTTDERRALEAEIVRKCLTRVDKQVGMRGSAVFNHLPRHAWQIPMNCIIFPAVPVEEGERSLQSASALPLPFAVQHC